MELPVPICMGCGRPGHEIAEYIEMAAYNYEWDQSDDALVAQYGVPAPDPEEVWDVIRSEEGTYNHENGHFLCTVCYIRAGQPSSPYGWTCP